MKNFTRHCQKKYLLLCTLFLFVLMFVAAFAVDRADEVSYAGKGYEISNGEADWLDFSGYDLNGYQVSIAFHNYNKRISGVYRGFTVTLDKKFLAETGRVENGVFHYCFLFDYLTGLFTANGYTVSVDELNGQFQASMDYETTTDFYIANGINGYEVSENTSQKSSSFLFNDYHSQSTTVFAIIEQDDNLLNVILNACYQVGASRDKILLNYVYGTPYKLIDSDADEKTYVSTQRLYLHSYNMTMDEKNRVINLYQHTPNAIGWYILAIIIALPFIAAPLIYMIIKRKKHNNFAKDIFG